MYIRIGDKKILVQYVEFLDGDIFNLIRINNEISINKDWALDINKDKMYQVVQLHKDWYYLPQDYEKIKKVLEDM